MSETHNNKPNKVRITPGYTCGGKDYRYKCWDNLDNLKNGGIAYSRHPDYTYPLIAGKNGTYKQPAPLDLTEFGYNFSSDIKIDKITVTYSVQTFINEGYYPSFECPAVSLLNTSLPSKKADKKITETKQTYTHTWENVPTSALNSTAFGVHFYFDQNRNTTPGRIELSGVKVEVVTTDTSDKIDLSIDAPNKITMGIIHELTCKIQKNSQSAFSSNILVELPFGLELQDITRIDGTMAEKGTKTYEGNNYNYIKWHVELPEGNSNALLKFKVKAVRPSNTFKCKNLKRITQLRLYDEKTKLEYSTLINVTQVEAVVQSDFFDNLKDEGKIYSRSIRAGLVYPYNVKVYSNDPMFYIKVLHLKYREGIDVITNLADIRALENVVSANYNTKSKEYEIVFTNKIRKLNIDIPVDVVYENAGEYDFTAYVTIQSTKEVISNVYEQSCIVLGTNYQKIGFSRILIDDYTDIMADGIEYTLGSLVKVTMSDRNYELMDFGNNYRIGVYNGGAKNIKDDLDFIDNVIWAEDVATTKLAENKVKFIYNSEEPLYMVWSHTYTADATGPYVTVNFSEPILAESSIYDDIKDNTGISLRPVINTILNSDYATAKMTKDITLINRTAIDDWQDGGLFEKDISILGMNLTFDYDVSNDCTVEAELVVNGKVSGTRDILLSKGKGTATLGSIYDLFGISPSDLINRDTLTIRPFELRFFVNNVYKTETEVKIKNCLITIEYIKRSSCQYGFTLDGEYSKDYGIILSEVSHPRGTKNEKSLYHVRGTDETIVNRVNVEGKDIELNIALGNSCEIEDQRYIIDRIVELFTNDRYIDSNKPIPKKLIFDHLPDRYFEVVRIEEFDDDFQIGKYTTKIKLLVPQGSTYDIEETVTGRHGYSPSSIAVRPTISYVSNTAGKIAINEGQLNQTLEINDNRIYNGSIAEIDCQNRKAYVDNVDISSSVDYNSSWFKLRGEYNFDSSTGTIVKVTYRIRRG